MTLTLPTVRIHPIMTAGRQREDEQRVLPVENRCTTRVKQKQCRLMQAPARSAPLPSTKPRSARRCSIGRSAVRRCPASSPPRPGGSSWLPAAWDRRSTRVLRSGRTGEEDADPRFPRGLGGDAEAKRASRPRRRASNHSPPLRFPGTLVGAVFTHRHTLLPIAAALTDQKSLFERVES